MTAQGTIFDGAKVAGFHLDLDADDEYMYAQLGVKYMLASGETYKMLTRLSILPVECYGDVGEVVQWLEDWNGRKVYKMAVLGLLDGEDARIHLLTRQKPHTHPNRRIVYLKNAPDNIQDAVTRWAVCLEGVAGKRDPYAGL